MSDNKKCPKCDAVNKSDSIFCSSCGTKLNDEKSNDAMANQNKEQIKEKSDELVFFTYNII